MTIYKITKLTNRGMEKAVYTTKEEAENAIATINKIAEEAKAISIRAYNELTDRWAGCLETITV